MTSQSDTEDDHMPDLRPVPVRTSPVRRLSQLAAGLALYGVSMGLMIRSTLGLDPWDVLHEALSGRTGLTFGTVTALTGVVVLLCWIPLRQRPGIGTVANIALVAVAVDATLAVVPPVAGLPLRITLLTAGVVLNALATAAYLGARLGPGPRDGLMTGLAARRGWSVRVVRTAIELTVLATGWLLGGTVGVGTVLYALAIGPLTQVFLPHVTWRAPEPAHLP
jgi:uncharacterized membrane protein YczE